MKPVIIGKATTLLEYKMLGKKIRGEQAKLIDKMVPFGTLSSNDKHIKMDPIKIEVN